MRAIAQTAFYRTNLSTPILLTQQQILWLVNYRDRDTYSILAVGSDGSVLFQRHDGPGPPVEGGAVWVSADGDEILPG